MPKWVSTAKRLPRYEEEYLVVKYQWENGALSYAIAFYNHGEWWINYSAKLVKPVKFWLEDDSDN